MNLNYAIFRSEPIYTLNDLAQIGSHNKREKKAYNSNPDINLELTKNNIELVPLDSKYVKDYLLYMIKGIEVNTIFTINFINKFRNSMDKCKDIIKNKKPKIYSNELVEYLFYDFYTKNEYFCEKLSISRNTASKYLSELEDIGILSSEKVGKEKIYKNNYLYELMKEW